MTRYSHTKLDVARKCMLQFKYQYIDKLPIIEGDMSASEFGSVVHEVAENYIGGGKAELLALYHTATKKIKLTTLYKSKVPLALQNIHDYWKAALSKNVKEVKHESDLTIELTKDIKLNGKIDILIEHNNGRFRIVDYKTNKSKEYANHTNQLSMYMLLLHDKYNIPYENMDCEVIYLALDPITKKGQKVENKGYENVSKLYKLEECDVECLKSEIEMIDKQIQKSIDRGEWKPKPGKFNCTYCPYNTICDKKWTPETDVKPSYDD